MAAMSSEDERMGEIDINPADIDEPDSDYDCFDSYQSYDSLYP